MPDIGSQVTRSGPVPHRIFGEMRHEGITYSECLLRSEVSSRIFGVTFCLDYESDLYRTFEIFQMAPVFY